jgi:hypothetical protein
VNADISPQNCKKKHSIKLPVPSDPERSSHSVELQVAFRRKEEAVSLGNEVLSKVGFYTIIPIIAPPDKAVRGETDPCPTH